MILGIELLKILGKCDVNLQVRNDSDDVFLNAENVEKNFVKGPHPSSINYSFLLRNRN